MYTILYIYPAIKVHLINALMQASSSDISDHVAYFTAANKSQEVINNPHTGPDGSQS